MLKFTRRQLLLTAPAGLVLGQHRGSSQTNLRVLWTRAPSDVEYMPRTRWWWPGSAVTREGITKQLESMRAAGIGGAEIVHTWRFYEKGNIEWLSPEWREMVRHAIAEAERLGMKIALVPSPGWDFGSPFVPPEERSKVLAPCWADFQGPFQYEGPLPSFKDFGTPSTGLFANLAPVEGSPGDQFQTVAAAGARLLDDKRIDPDSLVDLTSEFRGDAGRWRIGEGRWRLIAFRIVYTGQQNSAQDSIPRSWVVDHLSETAMRRYATQITGEFKKAFGDALGRVVDSLFADSFEAVPLANTILWSNSTLDAFKKRKGYDLAPYLPALWFDIGPRTAQVRYDVNQFLHQIALDFCFKPFLEACDSVGVPARMQPHYRFNEEIVQGAGAAHLPETEVTTVRFETVADPRKATVSGARFYGRPFVSAEAYTFLHPQRYRDTLEEMKAATDAFLRDGITRFYNHGYLYTPEEEVAPSRDMPWAERISPWMPWWPYYKHLAAYVSRCSALLRQGKFVADVLLYSPQADVWSSRAVFNIEQRVMKYGDVPKTLLANGYDYDIVNDHLLATKAAAENGAVSINGHSYRAIILPRVRYIPQETVTFLRKFAAAGGLLIALDECPAGLPAAVVEYGFKSNTFSPQEQPYAKTPPLRDGQRRLLDLLTRSVPPQFRLEGGSQSDGLTFHERLLEDGTVVYFVTNLSPDSVSSAVTFRVKDAWPELWDAVTGEIRAASSWTATAQGIEVPLALEPWNSVFVIFHQGKRKPSKPVKGKLREPIALNGPWTPALGDACRSGILTYTTSFEAPRRDCELDLGQVGCVAEVILNGKPLGVRWLQPYRLRIPASMLRDGANQLEVRVATTLLPRVQALKEMPPVPEHLVPQYGRALPPSANVLAAWKRDREFSPLPPSGLLGPVTLR